MRNSLLPWYRRSLLSGFLSVSILCCALPAYPLEKATIQLKWLHHFQFAGYYAALENGFYREAGLDVTILEGGPTAEVEKYVDSGQVDFGVGTSALLLNRAQGQDFVVLGQVFQHSPAVFLTPRKTGIHSVADMVGKRLMYSNNHGDMLALLNRNGVNENQIKKVFHQGDPYDLVKGKADVMLAYNFNEPFIMESAGEPYLTFSPQALGIDFYGDNFFTTRRLINSRPKFVQSFRDATLRGWRYAFDHKEEIVDLILAKYSQGKSREWLLFEANQLETVVQPNLVEIGYQSQTRWQRISETFMELGMLPKGFDPQPIIYAPGQKSDYRPLLAVMLVSLVIISSLAWLVLTFRKLNRKLSEQIGERKRAEEALTNSNKLLQTIIDTVPMRVFWKGPSLRYLGCNRAFAGDAGLTSPDDLVGKDDYQLVWKAQAELYQADDQQVIDSGIFKLFYDEPQTTPEGQQIWLRTSKVPLRNEANETIGVLGIYEDITEHKQAEIINMRFLLRQRAILDNLPMMAWLKDTESRLEMVNEAYARACGRSVEECIGKTDLDLFPREMAEGFMADDRQVCISGRKKRTEETIATPEGIRWHHTYKTPLFDEQGQVVGTTGIAHDITEHKNLEQSLRESEEQFRTLCDSAPIGIFRTNSIGNNIYTNPRWEEIAGMSAEECKGAGWINAIHPDDRQELDKAWSEAMRTGQSYSLEHRQLTRRGEIIWVRALANPIINPDGTIAGYVGTVEDITELSRARQELIRTQKLDSLGLLAGGIAHDFNNILTTILGSISLARIQLQHPEKLQQRLEAAENATVRAKDLTQQLLTFARGGEPIKKIIKLDKLLQEAAGFAIHGTNIRSEFVITGNLWPVEADEGQLSQVIHNLVLNAVQSMPNGGTVTIRAENHCSQPEGKGFVSITVEDKGVGIPEEDLQRIFDPYFTTKQLGSGLGLATCYSIIKKHGGNIKATSVLGKGSIFHLMLPATEGNGCEEQAIAKEFSKGSGRILVMDDESDIREISKIMLEELGYNVECAENGAQAIELYRQRLAEGVSFDLVIMDLTIPGGMGGKELIGALLTIDPGVRGIVSSGYSTDPVMADYAAYGFCAVLSKPYRLEEMSRVLQELLSSIK